MKNKFKNLQNKIYSMSNSFLPLDMFFNDIRDNKAKNFDKDGAYKDLDIIANFIIDLQGQLAKKDQRIAELEKGLVELKEEIYQKQLAIQELEEVKVNLKDRISMMKNEEHSYLQKVVAWHDICDQINQQIKELKGE